MKVDLNTFRNPNLHKFKRLCWEVAWTLLARTTPRWALNGWRRGLLSLFGAVVGEGVRIQGSAQIWQPWFLRVGANSWIDSSVKLYSVDSITIGHDAVISEGAFICTAGHDISSPAFALKTAPIVIGDYAWVCSRAIVLPGVTVGEGAVVAAGAVVTADVEPWTVVAGNPAKFIKRREIKDAPQ